MSANDTSRPFAEGKDRFGFGRNWEAFSPRIDRSVIEIAKASIRQMLRVESLASMRVLDIGCGSGLFSLAARELGAAVTSFDYDPTSVSTTRALQQRHRPTDSQWLIEQGSVLDRQYLERLGRFDMVYSWGVLHHTGAMWDAIENAAFAVKPGGRLFIAIYNDQGRASKRWLTIKKLYNALPSALRWLVLVPAIIRLRGPMFVRGLLKGTPLKPFREYGRERGMSHWHDVIDWVGGLPFEVAKPEEIFYFLQARGFKLDGLKTCAGGRGCNEFVATKQLATADATARRPN
jgi:SAM-dependent methyltransferase